jgi:hypothetical protein
MIEPWPMEPAGPAGDFADFTAHRLLTDFPFDLTAERAGTNVRTEKRRNDNRLPRAKALAD